MTSPENGIERTTAKSKNFPDVVSQQNDQQHTANATNPEEKVGRQFRRIDFLLVHPQKFNLIRRLFARPGGARHALLGEDLADLTQNSRCEGIVTSQGVEINRPSEIFVKANKAGGVISNVRVGGHLFHTARHGGEEN